MGGPPRAAALLLALGATTTAISGQQSGLVYPVDVVADADGVLVADFKAPGVLRIDRQGDTTPIALGEGRPRTPLYGTRALATAPDGDGWLVADPATFALYRVRATGAVELITDELITPQGIAAFDATSVLVSDLRGGIGAVMRVGLDGTVEVFAEIDSPKGIVADGPDGFAVVSTGERAVYRLSRDGGVGERFRGAPLEFPHDLVRLADGTLLITDGYAGAIWSLSSDGRLEAWVAGPPLVAPQGIALAEDGTVLIADPQAGAILRVDDGRRVQRWVEAGAGR